MGRSSNAVSAKRDDYRNRVLALIREREDASRARIKTLTRLSMETVLDTVNQLLADGLVEEAGAFGEGVGRKATRLLIRPQGAHFLGLKFNASVMTGVLMDFAMNEEKRMEIPLPEGLCAGEVLRRMESIFDCLSAGISVRGIGVGLPGLVDQRRGVGRRYVHIADWIDVPLRDLLEVRYHCPVAVASIALCSARALMRQSACDHLVYLMLGRGVGMAAISDGRTVAGADGIAGECGHIRVVEHGARCECGKSGCLETVAGQRGILRTFEAGLAAGRYPVAQALLRAERGEETAFSALSREQKLSLFFGAVRRADPDAQNQLADIARAVGDVAAYAVVAFNPGILCISGDIAVLDGFREQIIQRLRAHCLPDALAALRIQCVRTDNAADALGAAALSLHTIFSSTP